MFNAIYCEFLKLKRSYFYLAIAVVICSLPLFLCTGWLHQGAFVLWHRYIFQVEQMSFILLNIPLYALISSYIYTREFSNNTANVLFSYPVNRIKIFISKLVVILIVTLSITILQILLTALSGLLLPHEELTKEILLIHLKINLYASLFQYALLPICIFIALLSRNIIVPIIYGGIVTIANMFLLEYRTDVISDYIPIMYPLKILLNSFKYTGTGKLRKFVLSNSGQILSNTSIIIAILIFIIGLSLCITYYLKTDID